MTKQSLPWRRLLTEGFVIVASILLAFAIDAAWDGAQQRDEDRELLDALIADFEEVHSRLGPDLARANEVAARGARFLAAAESGLDAVPIDSLRAWYSVVYTPVGSDLATPAYDALIASGNLDLVRDPVLREALSDFAGARGLQELMRNAGRDAFFFGPVWEVRRRVGILKALTAEDAGALTLTEAEQRRILGSTESIAALDALYAATAAITGAMTVADEASARVVEELRALRADL